MQHSWRTGDRLRRGSVNSVSIGRVERNPIDGSIKLRSSCRVIGKVQLQSLVISPERIKVMDEQGIDIEALSLNPIFWSKAEPDLAGQVVTLQNAKLAEFCAAQPDRFAGLASVALQHADLAAEQLKHAVKALGLRGALIGGSVNGEERLTYKDLTG
jgi:predicted TIM-barrel fold metal-dependent hydrolase